VVILTTRTGIDTQPILQIEENPLPPAEYSPLAGGELNPKDVARPTKPSLQNVTHTTNSDLAHRRKRPLRIRFAGVRSNRMTRFSTGRPKMAIRCVSEIIQSACVCVNTLRGLDYYASLHLAIFECEVLFFQ
jgi:hypothetical protein